MSNAPNNSINRTSMTGQITWLDYYPERQKTVFTMQNECGVFFVECTTPETPTWKTSDTVLVDGMLFSRPRKGHRDTSIQAKSVTLIQSIERAV